ncbi:hypothetical protein M569_14347, partial [Genlisea aurea]
FFFPTAFQGCDASVLIDSTAKNTAEKDSAPDVTLRGFQQIDTVKAAVEKACPGVVSCADILALVARDAISSIKGPFWEVPLGRRDGTVSLASEALANIPAPFFNINQLASSFASKGLTVKDLVVLSGAHTIGRSHCSSFSNRIYNFSQKNPIDPTLNPQFAATLRQECPATGNLQNIIINMDEITPETFDINYYTLVKENRGLFQSDAALLDNPTTDSYVQQHSASAFQPAFFNDFAESMVKMGNIGVLTGSQGQIRKICSAVN